MKREIVLGGGVEIGRRLDRAKNWYKTGENQIRVATRRGEEGRGGCRRLLDKLFHKQASRRGIVFRGAEVHAQATP